MIMRPFVNIVTLMALLLGVHTTLAEANWLTDWEQAKKLAAKETQKDILLDFTGSDWCGWCKRLKKEVFSQEAFAEYAKDHLVLMEVDFPRGITLPEKVQEQNKALRDQFGIRGYPTIFLADEQGRPFAKTGYKRGGAEAYVAHLRELHKIREERDAAFAKAAKADGVKKAKLLAKGLTPISVDLFPFYEDELAQIKKLDPKDATGFKDRLIEADLAKLSMEIRSLARAGKREEALAKVDAFIASTKPKGELRQKILFTKLQLCPANSIEGLTRADALMDEIVAIDKKSETGKRCIAIKARIADLKQRVEQKQKK